jgi:hypothetical protein
MAPAAAAGADHGEINPTNERGTAGIAAALAAGHGRDSGILDAEHLAATQAIDAYRVRPNAHSASSAGRVGAARGADRLAAAAAPTCDSGEIYRVRGARYAELARKYLVDNHHGQSGG